jgi:hypothetical protein
MAVRVSRLKAFLVHLAVSAGVLAATLAVFVFGWFPPPYFFAEGAWRAAALVSGVDAVVGPLLTLVVFNPKKPKRELVRDLSIIGLLQIAALSAGLWTLSTQRTAAVILSDGVFYAMDAASAQEIGAGRIGSGRPRYLVADLPRDLEERQRLRQEALTTKTPLFTLSAGFLPLGEESREEVAFSAPDVRKFLRRHPEEAERLEKIAAGRGKTLDDFYFFPVICRFETVLLVLSRADLSVVGSMRNMDSLKDLY